MGLILAKGGRWGQLKARSGWECGNWALRGKAWGMDARLNRAGLWGASALVARSGGGVAPRLFEVDGELVDLRRQNKVVLAQAADGVGPEFDRDVAVAFDMEIGVMGVFFSDAGAFVEEAHAGHEVFDGPIFADPLAVVGEAPAVELLELGLGLLERVGGDASFAGEAFLLAELAGGLGVHDRFASGGQ